ncbi:MAG: hypothetical protein QJR01_05045 [Kyrpidia sp.]|nr:hypothetical protein [Kyrpidia sp.]
MQNRQAEEECPSRIGTRVVAVFPRRRTSCGTSGWTLVEVLAAVVLLALVVVPILTLKGTVLQTDVVGGKRSQAVGLASAILELAKYYGPGNQFALTSTVQTSTGTDPNSSINQPVPVPIAGQSTGWQTIRYLSGADTGISYNLSVTPADAGFVTITVQVKYTVGAQQMQESLWTISKQ